MTSGTLAPATERDDVRDDRPPDHRPDQRHDLAEGSIQAVEAELMTLFASFRDLRRRSAAGIHPSLSPAGYSVLHLLSKQGPMRASAIAELLEVDRSAVSRLLQTVECLGLVERHPDQEDGRAHLVGLTPLGTQRMADVRGEQQATLRQSFRQWSREDIDHLAQLLGQLNAMANESYRP